MKGFEPDEARLQQLVSSIDVRLDGGPVFWNDLVDFVLWEGRNKDAEVEVMATPTIIPMAINNVKQEQQHHHHSQSIRRIVRTSCTRNPPLYITASADGSVQSWFVDNLQHRNTWTLRSRENTRRTSMVTDLAYSAELEQVCSRGAATLRGMAVNNSISRASPDIGVHRGTGCEYLLGVLYGPVGVTSSVAGRSYVAGVLPEASSRSWWQQPRR